MTLADTEPFTQDQRNAIIEAYYIELNKPENKHRIETAKSYAQYNKKYGRGNITDEQIIASMAITEAVCKILENETFRSASSIVDAPIIAGELEPMKDMAMLHMFASMFVRFAAKTYKKTPGVDHMGARRMAISVLYGVVSEQISNWFGVHIGETACMIDMDRIRPMPDPD